MTDGKMKKIEELITMQEEALSGLRNEIEEIDSGRLISENERLRESLSKSEEENRQLRARENELKKQLEAAKASLFAKMANEKFIAFSKTQNRIENMYYTENSALKNRLSEHRSSCMKSIAHMKERVNGFSEPACSEMNFKLLELENEINQHHDELSQRLDSEYSAMLEENSAASASLKNEELTETEKRLAVKQKSLEAFIGLNVLSKAGILLFIIGIIALGRFAYIHLTDVFKGIIIFALGGALIAGGEFFHKKEKTAFSTALISGGVAVLYAAAATSYFALELLGIGAAFALCAAITAGAVLLSIQLKSQIVCAFGAIGGYLPLVAAYMIGFGSAAADKTFLPVSAVYFCLLAVIIFLMTYNKCWYAAQYIGYGFQLLSVIGIVRCAWVLKDVSGFGYAPALAACFAAVSFIIYLLMPASKVIRGRKISVSDIVLMGLNTVSGAVSVSVAVSNCFAVRTDGNRIAGIMFLVFAFVYALILGAAAKNSKAAEKSKNRSVMNGFIIGGLIAFSLLIVPLSFGWIFIGIAWAAEGAIIAITAKSKGSVLFEAIGFACMLLSVIGFAIAGNAELQSIFAPAAIISLTVIFAGFWLYTLFVFGRSTANQNVVYIILEAVMAAATTAYFFYIYRYILALPMVKYYCEFTNISVTALCFILTALLLKFKILDNRGASAVSIIFAFIGFLVIIGADIGESYRHITLYYGAAIEVKQIIGINLVLLAGINPLSVAMLSGGAARMINEYRLPAWIYTAVISASSLLLITIVLMSQFNIGFSNVLISALYIAAACVLLFVGFRKRYTVVRAGGLVLILAALAKLCFVDTHSLNTGWKIGAYFAFGAVLIAISFFYQRFSKRLEAEAEAQLLRAEP